jgi:hypothetical protein
MIDAPIRSNQFEYDQTSSNTIKLIQTRLNQFKHDQTIYIGPIEIED